MSDSRIHRVTLFKAKDEDKPSIIAAYEALKRNAIKVLKPSLFSDIQNSCIWQDGKSYILSIILGEALSDQRSQGYTVVAKLEFGRKEDCDYYDAECPGHMELKRSAGHLVQGLLTVNFHPVKI